MAERRSRRQEAAVSASIRKQLEAARLQKAEGRTHNSECSFEQADRIVQAAKGRRRQKAQRRVHL